jgi:predicted ribosomally synthesized peptide with nif11-like leader
MALQAAKDFLQKLQSEQELNAKFQNAVDEDARHQLAQAAGFDFTRAEFKQAVQEILTSGKDGELTADQLQKIAGGYSSPDGEFDWNDKLAILIGNRQ